MVLPVNGSTHLIPAYYSFIDPERMKGWVGWPVADGLPTLVVTHQLQVERRTGKVRQSETDVLPLCHATNSRAWQKFHVKCILHRRWTNNGSVVLDYKLLWPQFQLSCQQITFQAYNFIIWKPANVQLVRHWVCSALLASVIANLGPPISHR